MNPHLKARWLRALRSGNYTQAQKGLRESYTEYDCLGVLADVIDPLAWQQTDGIFKWRGRSLTFLPSHILDDPIQDRLATMNDEGATFDELADFIEASL